MIRKPVYYLFNGKVAKFGNSVLGTILEIDPYNPYKLPDRTVRVKYVSGTEPPSYYGSTLIDADENIWQYKVNSSDWYGENVSNWEVLLGANFTTVTTPPRLRYAENLVRIESADLTGLSNLNEFLKNNTTIQSVENIKTPNITNIYMAFFGCTSLTKIPMFDVTNVTLGGYAFKNCTNVQTGALAMYQALTNKTSAVTFHTDMFKNCGSNTTTGAAELAQIPSDWGGTGS